MKVVLRPCRVATRSFNGLYMPVSPDGYWMAGEAYWWCSTEAYDQGAFYWNIYKNSTAVFMGSWFKLHGLSVRCLKDNIPGKQEL